MDIVQIYKHFLQLRPLGVKFLSVENDHNGMKPEKLREVLSNWNPSDATNPQSDIPKVLYTVPNGCNPTGASLSLSRRKEIYKVCFKQSVLDNI